MSSSTLRWYAVSHLQHLTINILENDQHKTGVKNLLRANPQLKSLSLFSYERMNVSAIEFSDMISENQSLLKLSADFRFYNSIDAIRFVNEHPLISELDVMGSNFTADDVIYLIQHLNSLNIFKFSFNTHQDREQFEAVLSRKHLHWIERWKYHEIYTNGISMTRKWSIYSKPKTVL